MEREIEMQTKLYGLPESVYEHTIVKEEHGTNLDFAKLFEYMTKNELVDLITLAATKLKDGTI